MLEQGGPLWTKFPRLTTGQYRQAVEIAGRGRTHYQWSDQERTRVAVQWLRDKATAESQPPFAVVLGYDLPHCPIVAPKELFDYYYDQVQIPEVEERQPATIRCFRELRGLVGRSTPSRRTRQSRIGGLLWPV
jgi:hypothetical protein